LKEQIDLGLDTRRNRSRLANVGTAFVSEAAGVNPSEVGIVVVAELVVVTLTVLVAVPVKVEVIVDVSVNVRVVEKVSVTCGKVVLSVMLASSNAASEVHAFT